MRFLFCFFLLLPGMAAALPALTAGADVENPTITWKKTVVDRGFHSEGVAVADVNRDGKLDILAGDVWYEAPDWTMHAIRPVRSYGDGSLGGRAGYSRSFACWADDLNGDGWPDLTVIGLPGD